MKIGGIELLNIDCMEYMATLEDNAFDLAIVDPPYGIRVNKMSYLFENTTMFKQRNGNRLSPYSSKKMYKQKHWDNIPSDDYFLELLRVSKDQIIWGVDYFEYCISYMGYGRIIWNKMVPEGVSFKTTEKAFCSSINYELEIKLMWSGMCQAKSLSEPTTQQGNKSLNEKRIHPTQKPVLLYKWLLKNIANPADKILDTHLGSGSSAIAAANMGFEFVGCELDTDYFNAAVKRFKEQTQQIQMFK